MKHCALCLSPFEVVPSESYRKFCSQKCKGAAQSIRQSGEGSHFWEGGKTTENARIRNHPLTAEWRQKVFTRDAYTCQACLRDSSEIIPHPVYGQLTAHHVLPFSDEAKLRLKVSNGITLCWRCHGMFHSAENGEYLEKNESRLRDKAARFFKKEPLVYMSKMHGSALQERGLPDFLGVVAGRACAIELKIHPNFVSPCQRHCLREMAKAGTAVFVCRSIDEVKRAVISIKQGQMTLFDESGM